MSEATIIHGDCLDVMRSMSPGSFELIITSPPYNLGTTSGGGFADTRKYPNMKMGKWAGASNGCGLAYGYDGHNDAMSQEAYAAWQKECLGGMWRLLTDDGAIYYNHKPRVQNGILVTPLDYNPGLPVRQIVIWMRAGGINFSPTHYVPTHEWIVIFAKPAFRLKSKGASGVGDVWQITQEANPDHPAPFPVRLPMMILETTAAQTVLDPFAGIATTGVACLRMGRTFVGIEKSADYVALGRKRLDEAKGIGGLYNPTELVGLFDEVTGGEQPSE